MDGIIILIKINKEIELQTRANSEKLNSSRLWKEVACSLKTERNEARRKAEVRMGRSKSQS
ncbi:hypothetical protein P4521_05670, partial [Geobacillus stearothermophilus]|uniref:hypothetical protein n=1 Tax=Geobacillus stearothermophilus TaxID=1422 RepID=UPI002E1A6C99|nr:hypothetical protein [Geobacillus stearothermophilus]